MKSLTSTLFKFHNLKTLAQRSFSSNLKYTNVDFKSGIKTVTMCDTKTRNSLSLGMMENLIETIKHENDNPELRAIVIGSNGPVFSAGHNLKELSTSVDSSTHRKVFEVASELMGAIIDCPVPVLAKINGLAAAAGCQLVAQCDLAICTENSTFSTPGVNFGIFCSTPGVAISRKLPRGLTMKMLLTGQPISAQEAKNFGLICEMCKENELDAIVDVYCNEIKRKSREVIEIGKKFYYEQLNCDIREAYSMGGDVMVENLQLNDGKEGINSFVEKRSPVWKHGTKC